eukprot:2962697-Rhodomonas_salina.2
MDPYTYGMSGTDVAYGATSETEGSVPFCGVLCAPLPAETQVSSTSLHRVLCGCYGMSGTGLGRTTLPVSS